MKSKTPERKIVAPGRQLVSEVVQAGCDYHRIHHSEDYDGIHKASVRYHNAEAAILDALALAQPAIAAPVLSDSTIHTLHNAALIVFGGAKMAQPVRYAIEWYQSSLLALAAHQPTPAASPPHGALRAPCEKWGAEDATASLLKVLEIVGAYLPPDGISAETAMAAVTAVVDPWPLSTPGNRSHEDRYEGYKGRSARMGATDDQRSAWNEGRKAARLTVEVAAPVAPTRMQTNFTEDDELSLLLDVTRNMALRDKSLYTATRWVQALGGVQSRLAALSTAKPEPLSDAQIEGAWFSLKNARHGNPILFARAVLKLQAGGAAS